MVDYKKEKQIDILLSRGVESVYPNLPECKRALLSGKKLTVYIGIDPTGPTLHLGHGLQLLKLKEFIDLGHKGVLLIGDSTSAVGDPSGKISSRQKLDKVKIKENYKNYRSQIKNFLDLKKVKVVYNSKWFSKMSADDFLDLASEFTVGQMMERDMFQERLKKTEPIYLNELLYPLMQGYDSVMLDADVEIGGNDQTFNMLTGRTMQKRRGKEKFVIALKLLVDPTGKKMGKTEGNMIALDDKPAEIYGKVMSWPDSMIASSFEICTNLESEVINNYLKLPPKEAKMALARSIIALYKGVKQVEAAEADFISKFQKKEIPANIKTITVSVGRKLADILLENDLVDSKAEFGRLVSAGGIYVDDKRITNIHYQVVASIIVKIGKKKFVKIVL